MEFKERAFENFPEWNSIEFIGKFTSIEVASLNKDDEVEITLSVDSEDFRVFLNQENLKHLIEHLQKQIK